MAEAAPGRMRIGLEGKTRVVELTLPATEPPPYEEGSPQTRPTRRASRVDGPAKVTGRAVYASDEARPGMLHALVLRSPHANARLVSIDTSKAEAIPGVLVERLEKTRVRYHGESILAVAAPSPALAEDALEAVRVTYEALPHVASVAAARRAGAPVVFERKVEERRSEGDAPAEGAAASQSGNVKGPRRSGTGDVEKGFADAEDTLELTATTACQTHVPLETHAVLCEWKGDELHVTASTQGTFSVRDELAEVFGIPKAKVLVTAEYVGGGFGSKFGAGDPGVLAARLARKAGRPVRLVPTRKDEHLALGSRPDSFNTVKLGFKKDGAVTAVRYTSFGTAGVATGTGTGGFVKNAYGFPNVAVEESDVFTHLGPGCAMRAPGHPQGAFAVEAALDEMAARLGLDPLVVRLKNDRSEVRKVEWEIGARAIGWSRRGSISQDNREAARAGRPLRRGLGCSASVWYTIVRDGSQALVRIHRDGQVEVENGVQEIGGGIRTAMALVAAEELGLPVAAIQTRIGRSTYPFGPASGGSTTTTSLIPAVRAAAWSAARKLAELAAPLLGAPSADLVRLKDGQLVAGSRSLPWKKVCAKLPSDTLIVTGDRAKDYEGSDARIFGCQLAEVLVDVETGLVRVERVVAVHDCGIPVNRTGVESQIRGGVLQGVSYALFEERVVDQRNGRFLNPNVEQYRILGARDVPAIEPILVNVYAGRNNGHVRGIGEPANIATAAAVANAVSHALGARVLELPITPARVLALRGKASGVSS